MKQDDEAERAADQEGRAPAHVGGQQRGIEEDDGSRGAERGADPEAAVDDEVGPAAHARRDQLLDGGVDGGIFAADAGAGEEAAEREGPQVPGEGGGCRGREVDGKRDEEQLLAAPAIGQPAEEDGAEHGAGEVGAADKADVGGAELQDRAFAQRAGHGAGERHLEAVEDPGDAECDDDERVEAAPRQAVEPGGDVGFDDAGYGGRRRRLQSGRGHA